MAWYAYWQKRGEDEWNLCLEEALPKILETENPTFTSALFLDTNLEDDDLSSETFEKVRYKGDFYVDFDGESIGRVIRQVNKYLDKIEDLGVRLDEVEVSLTGGRGFHLKIPQRIFIKNPAGNGYTFLPYIYKELAYKLTVDTMDLRVYSGRKGRMWRTFGVKRDNGNYKVQCTAREVRDMDEAKYYELVSEKRPQFEVKPPTYAPEFALEFSKAKDRVEGLLKNRRKSNRDEELVKRFNGETPASLAELMSGEGLKEGGSFHSIAMQIVLACIALGLSEDEVVEKCAGLCEKHESDGFRYNTEAKRKREIRRLYHYFKDNPCYNFSVGGLKSIADSSTDMSEFDFDDVPEAKEGELEGDEEDEPLFLGLKVRQEGIWKDIFNKETKEKESIKVSSIGISNVHELLLQDTGESTGFEVTIHIPTNRPLRKRISNNDFDSKMTLRRALGAQAFINLPDSQVGALQEIFRAMATKSGSKVFALPLEGINTVIRDREFNGSRYMLRFADRNRVWGYEQEGEPKYNFRLEAPYNPDGEMGTDLMSAGVMENTIENRAFFDDFFSFFDDKLTARVFGWYISCFLTQHVRSSSSNQFPILHSFGEAGSGKTSFNQLCANMHYHLKPPKIFSAGNVTGFAMEVPLASSGTIPVVFDEFKPREMAPQRVQAFLMLARNNFSGVGGGKGRVNRDSGTSHLEVASTPNTAPLAFMAEAKVGQEAVLHRSVLAAFPHMHEGSENSLKFQDVCNQAFRMGMFGRTVLDIALKTPVEVIGEEVISTQRTILTANEGIVAGRTQFSYAVVAIGLKLGKAALNHIFGDRYNAKMDALLKTILGGLDEAKERTMAEIDRVINDLAYLSNRSPLEQIRLEQNEDFLVISAEDGKEYVDIHIRNSWDKYARFVRTQGGELLFDREVSFIDALRRHRAQVKTTFADNPAMASGRNGQNLVRLDLEYLENKVGIEEFRR